MAVEEKLKRQRIRELDVLKGITIILMVIGHSGAPNGLTAFIYLFHMAAFIIASGFFFSGKSSDSVSDVWKYFWKKVRQLWLPYFLWTVVFTLLNNVFLQINVYTDNEAIRNYVPDQYVTITSYMTPAKMFRRICTAAAMLGGSQMGGHSGSSKRCLRFPCFIIS